ncbi:hypothetical protein OAR97_00175 [Arcobacteraceae bacterium]|nr:hypothetical protein [Arcobacteraceae bacterium]
MNSLIKLGATGLVALSFLTGCGVNNSTQVNTPSTISGAKTIYISNSVKFAKSSRIAMNIKKECNLNHQMIDYLKVYGAKNDINFEVTSNLKSKKNVLKITIDEAISQGGAFRGHNKFVAISGNLIEKGKSYSFKAARRSGGGFFGAYKSSCAVLGGAVKRLARDTAEWATFPDDGARLGDQHLLRY